MASTDRQVTRALSSLRRTFCLHTRRAPSANSPSTTRHPGALAAMARPTQPLPAHRSNTRAPSPAARALRIPRSASTSVSIGDRSLDVRGRP